MLLTILVENLLSINELIYVCMIGLSYFDQYKWKCCQSQLDEMKVGIDLYCCAELSEKKLLCLAS